MNAWLLDTGPIVAFLDASDEAHARVVRAFERFTGRFITTDAVIVETMHLVSRTPDGPGLIIDFLLSSQTAIHSSMSAESLIQAGVLMQKYADVPMDFAPRAEFYDAIGSRPRGLPPTAPPDPGAGSPLRRARIRPPRAVAIARPARAGSGTTATLPPPRTAGLAGK